MRVLAPLLALLVAGCVHFPLGGTTVITNSQGKAVAQIQTVVVKPEDVPPTYDLLNPIWWLQCGGTHSTWTAPLINNGTYYLPNVTNQLERNILWWLRNPACNFVGFVIGFEGKTYKVTGTSPVTVNTMRDLGKTGWKWSVIDGWAPFVSYAGQHVEWYVGWRPNSGGFGSKFVIHADPP
jgi:hypothetical protein